MTAGPVAPVARQPSRAPSRNPTPPPRPHPAAAPTQRVRRGRSRATGQRCLRRPQQWGPEHAKLLAVGRRTYGVTPGARRAANRRAAKGLPVYPYRYPDAKEKTNSTKKGIKACPHPHSPPRVPPLPARQRPGAHGP